MNRKLSQSLAVMVVLLIAADWLTKFWIVHQMGHSESLRLLDGWLSIVHRENPGVAFSMFADLPTAVRTPLLTLVSAVGVVLFGRIILASSDAVVKVGAAMVLAGAVGNLGERMLTGHVTDFVLVSFFPFVFNLADSAITVGAVVLAARLMFSEASLESRAEPIPVVDPD